MALNLSQFWKSDSQIILLIYENCIIVLLKKRMKGISS